MLAGCAVGYSPYSPCSVGQEIGADLCVGPCGSVSDNTLRSLIPHCPFGVRKNAATLTTFFSVLRYGGSEGEKTSGSLGALHTMESNMTKKSALKNTVAHTEPTAQQLLDSTIYAIGKYFDYQVTYTNKEGMPEGYNGLEFTQISVLNGMCYNLSKQIRYFDDQEDALRVEAKNLIEQAQNGVEIWEGNFTRVKEKLVRIQDCKHAAEFALKNFVERHDILSNRPFSYNAPVNFKTADPNKQTSTAASELANMMGISFEPRRSNGTL